MFNARPTGMEKCSVRLVMIGIKVVSPRRLRQLTKEVAVQDKLISLLTVKNFTQPLPKQRKNVSFFHLHPNQLPQKILAKKR